MEITHQQIKDILKTLPIGFYAKRPLDVELDENEDAYFDPMTDKIRIGSKIIIDALKEIDKDTFDLETATRTLLYHEVSHALLTPQDMLNDAIINTFEDERIETLLENFYNNVDFKTFVKKVNKFDSSVLPKTPFEEFYNVVRFRCGETRFVSRVECIIMHHSHLNRFSNKYDIRDYRDDIYDLYNNIKCKWEFVNTEYDDDLNKHKGGLIVPSESKNIKEHEIRKIFSHDDIKNIVASSINYFCNTAIISDINTIFAHYKHHTTHNGSAINTYSGIFNPRSVMRDDYKYFIQQNRAGHVKAFSKLNLNLFIDSSGSFSSNERLTNQILYALRKFETQNKDFSFTLTTMSIGQQLHTRTDRILKCSGGNRLDKHIFEQFKNRQLAEAQNINIVLFDGDALTDCYNHTDAYECAKNFKAFDKHNVVIISDWSNELYIKKNVTLAKVIFTREYVSELYKHIISSLNQLIK